MLAPLFDHLRVAVGDRGRLEPEPISPGRRRRRERGATARAASQRKQRSARAPLALPHQRSSGRSARGRPGRRRAASTARARPARPRGRSRRRAAGRASRRACSEPWLPPPAWLTPPQSTRLVAGRERDDEVAGVRRAQRRRRRGRAGRGSSSLRSRPSSSRASSAASSPSRSQLAAAQVGDLLPRAEAELAAAALDHRPTRRRSAAGPARAAAAACRRRARASRPGRLLRSRPALGATSSWSAALAVARQQVDVGGAAGRADRELGLLGAVVGGLQHRPLAGRAGRPAAGRGRRRSGRGRRARISAWSSRKRVEPAGRLDQLGEAVVGLGDRLDARLGPVAVGVVVVVGQREEQEVEAVLLGQLGRAAGRSSRRGCRGSRSTCRGPRGWRRGRRRRARAGPRCGGGT